MKSLLLASKDIKQITVIAYVGLKLWDKVLLIKKFM